MAKNTNAIAPKNTSTGLPAVPDYLRVENDQSVDELKQYVRPPRIKVVQSLTDEELRRAFGVGSVVLLPQSTCLVEMPRDDKGNPVEADAKPFLFTPLFFFAEYCLWNPLEVKGTVPAIRERTFDVNHEVARKAKNFGARFEPYPEDPKLEMQYVEHLNFICAVQGVEDACILSFARAEFSAGQKFASLTKMRSQSGCPLYGGVYAAHINHRANNKGDWYGLDIANPPEGVTPYVDAETFHQYKTMYEEFKEQHENALIRVDYEDTVEPTEAEAPSEAAATM